MCGSSPSVPDFQPLATPGDAPTLRINDPYTLPNAPQLPTELTDALKKSGMSLDQLYSTLSNESALQGQNRNILQQISGLVNEDGTINKDFVTRLKDQANTAMTSQTNLGNKAINYMDNLFNYQDSPEAKSLLSTQMQNINDTMNAGPNANPQIKQQRDAEFKSLVDSAARRGIRIQGDSLDNATSDSTAGSRIISETQKRYDLLNYQDSQTQQAQKNYAMSTGMSQALNTVGYLDSARMNNLNAAANFIPLSNAYSSSLGNYNMGASYSPAAYTSQMSGIAAQYPGLAQPYYNQSQQQFGVDTNNVTNQWNIGQMGNQSAYDALLNTYNAQNSVAQYNNAGYNKQRMDQYNADAASSGGMWKSIGSMAGMGAGAFLGSAGGPMGTMMGASLGGQLGGMGAGIVSGNNGGASAGGGMGYSPMWMPQSTASSSGQMQLGVMPRNYQSGVSNYSSYPTPTYGQMGNERYAY